MSVTVETTLGKLKFELYCDKCPKAVHNFLALCASNYYTGCIFHRNIGGFLVQTGDPSGTGKNGTSVYNGGEPFEDEFHADLKHDKRGVMSMANSGPNTNGSQFFITYAAHEQLNNKYTVFGKLIDGFDTLDKLEKVPVGEKYRPVKDISITNITIHANPLADAAED